MLLAILPFVAASCLYWMGCADLFDEAPSQVKSNWTTKLFLPVLTGSLGSLVAAAAVDDHSGLLLSASACGVTFSIMIAAGLRGEAAFFDLQLPVGTHGRRFERLLRWHLLRLGGIAVILYSCIATLIAVA